MTSENTAVWLPALRLADRARKLPVREQEEWLQGQREPAAVVACAVRILSEMPGTDEVTGSMTGSELVLLRQATEALLDECLSGSGRPALPSIESVELPGYELDHVISSGGSGVVVAAMKVGGLGSAEGQGASFLEYRRRVAIKFIYPDLHESSGSLLSSSEAAILGALEDPRIAGILDTGEVVLDGRIWPFITTEYVDGVGIVDFAEGLERRAVLQLAFHLCDALCYVHERGILHLDLKPQNILVTNDGTPKIIDFGISRTIGDPLSRAGTIEYMAPEQFRPHGDDVVEPTDARIDIYAVSSVLFELLTGRRVREGGVCAVLEAGVKGVAPEAEACADLGPELRALVLRGLAPEPRDRFTTMRELRDDLQGLLTGHPLKCYGGGGVYRARKFVRRHWASVSAGASVAVGLAVASITLARSAQVARSELARTKATAELATRLLGEVAHVSGVDPVIEPFIEELRAFFGAEVAFGDYALRLRELLADIELRQGNENAALRHRRIIADAMLAASQDPSFSDTKRLSVALVKRGDAELA